MRAPLVSRREAALWFGAFLVVAALLVLTRFTSNDADSTLYAGLSARLAQEPMSRWIAPEWWGLWPRIGLTGLYRDHPIGGFVPPALLGRLGIPGEQAAYIVGVATGLIALILIGHIVLRMTSRKDARAVLLLLQIMPVAFVFRIRANQEYAMLICLIVTVLGLDLVRRTWWGLVPIVAGLAAALIIKGAFVSLILLGAGVWTLVNPMRAQGSIWRPIAAGAVAIGALALVAMGYDAWYGRVTGEAFWSQYWNLQLSQVEVSTPMRGAATFVAHVGFYIVRLLWHPAPWSLALVVAAWRVRGRIVRVFLSDTSSATRGLLFAILYTSLLVLVLSTSSRVAERYVFSGTYSIATAGIVLLCRFWGRFADAIERLDRRVPALPAIVWFLLMVLRLGVGPFLPRIFL